MSFSVTEPVIFLPTQVEYITGHVDGSASLKGLFTYRKLRLQIPKAAVLKDTQKLLETVQITTDDFKLSNANLAVQKVEYSESQWELNTYDNREERTITVVFFVSHPQLKDLQIVLSHQQWRREGQMISDNILDTSSARVSLRFSERLALPSAKKGSFVEVDLSASSGIVSIPQQSTNYCINGSVVATTIHTEANGSLYRDGASLLDSAQITRQLFKKFKKDITISQRFSLLRSQDSHAFEAGQYINLESIYLSPEASRQAGLSEEDHYVVFATGVNYEAEEPLQEKALLLNKKLEVIEKRNLSECPGAELEPEVEFSGAG